MRASIRLSRASRAPMHMRRISGSAPGDESRAVFARVAQRYAVCGRGPRGYVAGKLRRDPVHRDLLALAASESFGDVLDIGGGRGQMGIALLEADGARSVLALDRSASHLEQARRAAAGLPFAARPQDFAECQELPGADTILLIDVLYQLAPATQSALLRNVARAARQRVLIRTLDPGRGPRGALTLAFEQAARFVSPHSGRHVNPPPVARLSDTLRGEGFDVRVAPCWKGTPFANVLLTARRRDQPAF